MFFSKDEEDYAYGQYMEQQAQYEMEAECQAEAERHNHLQELIAREEYTLHALEQAIYWLTSDSFTKSGLSAVDYLSKKLSDNFEARKPKPEPPARVYQSWEDDLPF